MQSINMQPKLLPSEKIYWHRTTLVRSLNGRPMELLTVTSQEGMSPSRRERVWDHPTFQNAKEGILFPEGSCRGVVWWVGLCCAVIGDGVVCC